MQNIFHTCLSSCHKSFYSNKQRLDEQRFLNWQRFTSTLCQGWNYWEFHIPWPLIYLWVVSFLPRKSKVYRGWRSSYNSKYYGTTMVAKFHLQTIGFVDNISKRQGCLSIISTCTRLSFLTIGILWSFVNSSSKKQVEAPKFNKVSILSLWEPRRSGMVKQQEGWTKRKGPWLVWSEESTYTVPIVARLLRFSAVSYLI